MDILDCPIKELPPGEFTSLKKTARINYVYAGNNSIKDVLKTFKQEFKPHIYMSKNAYHEIIQLLINEKRIKL